MANPTPIPIPKAEKWHALRMRVLPLLIFAGTMVFIVHLWRDTLMPPTFTGQVELIESRVASAEAGTLTELNVSRFQTGEKGTPLAIVEPIDRRVLDYDVRLQRLRADWLDQKVALATAESNLMFAEVELGRGMELFRKKVISPQELDAFEKKKQALDTDVSERKKLVADLGRQIDGLQLSASLMPENSGRNSPLLGSQREMKRPPVESELGRKVLTAPITGMVSMIFHRAGESVTAGEAILTIAAPSATHVIGYMREPIGVQPEIGMDVRIRSRDPQRSLAVGKVTRVGVALEPIAPALVNPMISRTMPEIGLPVEVTLPPGVQLRPGGVVDLTLLPQSKSAVASREM
jgi:HlyD family secretion protein